jgi:hypothetical protein
VRAISANIRFHTELCTNHEIRIELIEIADQLDFGEPVAVDHQAATLTAPSGNLETARQSISSKKRAFTGENIVQTAQVDKNMPRNALGDGGMW